MMEVVLANLPALQVLLPLLTAPICFLVRKNGIAWLLAFVATLGLPPFDNWHEILRQRLEQRFGAGHAYTYLIPGLQKVAQAAGRVIRTPEDTGVIWLIDDRFLQPQIRNLLPAWWA